MKKSLDKPVAGYWIVFILLFLFLLLALNVYLLPLSIGYDSKIISLFSTIRNPILTPIMVFFTYIADWYSIALLGIIGVAAFWKMRKTRVASALLVSVIGGELIVEIIKHLFKRARPDILSHLVAESGYGFPSGHSFVAFSFYGFMAYCLFRRARSGFAKAITLISGALIILAIGASRVYLGVHWPSDVLGSYLLGAAWISAIIIYLESKKELDE